MKVEMEPLEQRTMSDNAFAALRVAILNGSFPPGAQLRETQIAEQFGISRAPVREALKWLEDEGLVTRLPFRGSFVAEVSSRVISEIESLRRVLEPYVLESVMRDPEKSRYLDQLRLALDEMKAAAGNDDTAKLVESHLAFHGSLYQASGNQVLLDIWHSWESQLKLYLMVDHQSFSQSSEIVNDHEILFDALGQGDIRQVRRILKAHIHSVPWPSVNKKVSEQAGA